MSSRGRLPGTLRAKEREKSASAGSLRREVRPPAGGPWVLDLSGFANGDAELKLPGYPLLAQAIAQTVYYSVRTKKEMSGKVYLDSVRSFWRFYRDTLGEDPDLRLDDIGNEVGQLYKIYLLRTKRLRDSTANTYYNRIRRILSDARRLAGLDPWNLHWPALPRAYHAVHKDVDPGTFKPLYSVLKSIHDEALSTHDLGSRRLQAEGAEGDAAREAHRVLRGILWTISAPASSEKLTSQVRRLDKLFPGTGPIDRRRDALGPFRQFVPTWREMSAAYYLVLLHTGWNPETAQNIDVSADEDWLEYGLAASASQAAPTVAIYGFKNKVGREQVAFSLTRPRAHPYQVIRSMIERTQLLRAHLKCRLRLIEDKPETSLEDERAHAALTQMIASPWLYLKRTGDGPGGYVACLQKSSVQNTILADFTKQAVQTLRTRGLPADVIARHESLLSLRPSDFRDGFASFIFEEGMGSVLLLKQALNHRSLLSAQAYIRQRRQLFERMKRFGELQEVLWDEIQTSDRVDTTILFMRIRTGEVTPDQRERLQAHRARTRMGTGCLDPASPPPEISEIPKGGVCRVQRCTLCRHAVVFRDSLPALARREAELRVIRSQSPFERFENSTFRVEMAALEQLQEQLGPDDLSAFIGESSRHQRSLEAGEAYIFDQLPLQELR